MSAVAGEASPEDGEERRAGAGQEGGGNFGAVEVPHFEIGEHQMFGENRAFEIVDERSEVERLGVVTDAWDLGRSRAIACRPMERGRERQFDEKIGS